MEAKHTPGPWEVIDRRDARNRPCGLNVIGHHRDDDYSQIEPVTICRLPDGASSLESQCWQHQAANARLIAAAPELLEALDDLQRKADAALGFLNEHNIGGNYARTLCASISTACKAISKATGGAK
jgi:hypothetical protein